MDVETETRKMLAAIFKVEKSELDRQTRFVEDLFIKSIQVVELIAMTGHIFGVNIPLKEARKNKNIGQLIDYITARRGAQ